MREATADRGHRLRDGAIFVYTRPGAKKPNYHARLKIPGVQGYIIKALKTRDVNEALNAAEDLFYSLKAEQKQGLDIRLAGNLKFKELWKRFYAAHKVGLSGHRQKLFEYMSRRYFVPYFGEERVADMPDAFVEKYWDWRINFTSKAPPKERQKTKREQEDKPPVPKIPAQKTLDMEAGMLRQAFRWGKRVGCVKREPWIKSARVKHIKGVERRPSFTEAEWKLVYEHLREKAREEATSAPGMNGGRRTRSGPHAGHKLQREMLRGYLLFMANSGLRPNEARQLLWRDIRVERDEDGKPALVVEVPEATKTGSRSVVCREGTEFYLNRLKEVSKHTGPGDLIFCGKGGVPIKDLTGSFKRILTELKILKDREGKVRTVYSLRHFYCTQALLGGVPIHILARNMGTSIRYIETHYSHVLTVMQAKQLQTKKFRQKDAQ